MAHHDLKIWPDFYPAVADGSKAFEIRKNDRNYQVGDTLRLREYAPGPDEYTGREVTRRVTYILDGSDVLGYTFGLRQGFVALGLDRPMTRSKPAQWPTILEATQTLADSLNDECLKLRAENERLRTALQVVETVVDEQANDDGLWFIPQTITEDYLQRALRRLHAVIEGKLPEQCAVEALENT